MFISPQILNHETYFSNANPEIAFVLLFAIATPAMGQTDTEKTLLDFNRQLFETLILEQDPSFLLSVSDESYVVIAPGGVIESREQVIAGLRAFATVDSISIEKERVVQAGATAIVLNRLIIHGPLQGPVGEIGLGPVSVMIVFNQGNDGRWNVAARALSACHPAALERGLC